MRATAGSDFLLRLSYIGYVGEQIVIRTPQGTVQMGDIILKEQSVALDEVVISGSNITQKVDRMVVVPTATAMKNSYNPYDLMLNLAIPHLKVRMLLVKAWKPMAAAYRHVSTVLWLPPPKWQPSCPRRL